MGGGGHIIIRTAMKQALTDPLIHGILLVGDAAIVDPILVKDVNDWSQDETHAVVKVFRWAALNC